MADLKYKIVPLKNPIDKSVKFYARKISYEKITGRELLARLQDNSGMKGAVLSAACIAITNCIANFVCNGHSVQIGNLMSLRPTLSSTGVQNQSDFNASYIYGCRVRARWGSDIAYLQDRRNYNFIKDSDSLDELESEGQ
jgi:hypothetical protein